MVQVDRRGAIKLAALTAGLLMVGDTTGLALAAEAVNPDLKTQKMTVFFLPGIGGTSSEPWIVAGRSWCEAQKISNEALAASGTLKPDLVSELNQLEAAIQSTEDRVALVTHSLRAGLFQMYAEASQSAPRETSQIRLALLFAPRDLYAITTQGEPNPYPDYYRPVSHPNRIRDLSEIVGLFHGKNDNIVPSSNSQTLGEKIGVSPKIEPNRNHGSIVASEYVVEQLSNFL